MEYTEDKLSGWFDIDKQKPWEPGVYELTGAGFNCFAFWNGNSFSYAWRDDFSDAKELAFKFKDKLHHPQWFIRMTKWRGLSSGQAKPKKRANKRKTVYRVYSIRPSYAFYTQIACFDTLQEARDFIAKRAKLAKQTHFKISPLRFRV